MEGRTRKGVMMTNEGLDLLADNYDDSRFILLERETDGINKRIDELDFQILKLNTYIMLLGVGTILIGIAIYIVILT